MLPNKIFSFKKYWVVNDVKMCQKLTTLNLVYILKKSLKSPLKIKFMQNRIIFTNKRFREVSKFLKYIYLNFLSFILQGCQKN